MGLKRTNYEVKNMGVILPKAYAYIRDMDIRGNKGEATIVVQACRETAICKKPFEERTIKFDVNREENPYITAYRAAKTQKAVVYNKDTEKFEEKQVEGVFHGWEDDIV